MKKLFKTIHFDQSDMHVYDIAAGNDEWAISGAFAFSNVDPGEITGKLKQAFSNGFLSLQNMGRSTFVSVAEITEEEEQELLQKLAQHFMHAYEAPNERAALQVAQAEIDFAQSICGEQPINTVFTVKRSFDDKQQIHEEYRIVTPPSEPLHTKVWEIVDDE